MSNTVKIVSVNCQGLSDPRKRRDVFHYLRQKSYSIYLLLDTHFDPKMENCIRAEWEYKSYFASYNSNSRGVAILFVTVTIMAYHLNSKLRSWFQKPFCPYNKSVWH